MAASDSDQAVPLTLDQLVALNQEMAALVRAGVPLGEGLRRLADDLPGRSGNIAVLLAQRMEQGHPLGRILADHPDVFPPVYRAVVEAGVRAGRLEAALESLAGCARRLADTRRTALLSLLYPLVVFVVAWAMLTLFTVAVAEPMLGLFAESADLPALAIAARAGLTGLVGCRDSAAIWGPGVPLALVAMAGLWWRSSRRAWLLEPRLADRLLGWLPWTGRMLRLLRTASLADVLAMLVEHHVPLDEAILLSARTVGGSRMERAAEQIAAALKRGQPLGPQVIRRGDLPSVLAWLMAAGYRRGSVGQTMRYAADVYHRRARHQAEKVRLFLPIVLTVSIGGGVTLLYILFVLGSWLSLLRTLG